jgi:hypothetical protein
VFYASLGLAVSSLTTRRAFAMGGLAGLLVLSSAMSAVLVEGVGLSRLNELLALPAIPVMLVQHIFPTDELHGGPSGIAWTLAYLAVVLPSLVVLVRRYR